MNSSARRMFAGIVVCFCFISLVAIATDTNQVSPIPNAAATAAATEADHQRMMELLGIASIRHKLGNRTNSPYAANYNESKANPFPNLPDPLTLKDGQKVTTAEMWWKLRRPEIVEDFDREIYGRVPPNVPPVNWEITSMVKTNNGSLTVITKHLNGHVDNSSYPQVSVNIDLTLTTPANVAGPVPVIIQLASAPPPGRLHSTAILESSLTWQQQVLAKGWGYAVLMVASIQADNGAGLTGGIIGLCNQGRPRKPDDWGALRAWAWGASRVLDDLEMDKDVDAKRIGITGLSREGKAALVAMADDPRFAIAFISSSGEGGAKLYRHNFGEGIENLAASSEYHWMAGNFIKYAGPLNAGDLPVDAHELIALCAPRPVFTGCGGKGDSWVDPEGMFMAAAGAGPVYDLLGKKGLGTTNFPPIETAVVGGDLAFRQHTRGHTDVPNWPYFLNFAGNYFNATNR